MLNEYAQSVPLEATLYVGEGEGTSVITGPKCNKSPR